MSDDIARLGLFIDSSGVIRANKELRKLHGQSQKNEAANGKLSKSFNGLGVAIAAVGVVALTKNLLTQMNTYTAMSNKLKLVTNGTENLAAVQSELFNVAQEGRSTLEATTDLYFRFAKSTESLGISQTRLMAVTATTNKAVALSGTTAQAASAALFQMGQGLASGTLRGQELNSVLEQTPRVAQAIADGMGVPLGALRELAEQGLITSEVVIGALENQKETIDREMSGMEKTMNQAWTQIENVALRAIGSMDSSEIVSELDEFRSIISDPAIIDGLQSIASVFVTITGLAVKAAAGWGMIFKAISNFAAADSPATVLIEKIRQTQAMIDGATNEIYKSNLEKGLARYKSELAALTAESEATQAAAAASGGGGTGLTGGSPAEAAARVAEVAAAKQEAMLEAGAAEAELILLADALAIQAAMNHEDELTRIKEEGEANRLQLQVSGLRAAAGVFDGLLALMRASGKDQSKLGKMMARTSIVASTAAAVMSALEVKPYPLGVTLAAGAALKGAAQLRNVNSSGQAHDGMDNVPSEGSYNLQKGEMVLDPGTSEQVRNNALGLGGGGGVTFAPVIQAFNADEVMQNSDDLFIGMRDRLVDWMNEEGVTFA